MAFRLISSAFLRLSAVGVGVKPSRQIYINLALSAFGRGSPSLGLVTLT